jgi:hypothetical protein
MKRWTLSRINEVDITATRTSEALALKGEAVSLALFSFVEFSRADLDFFFDRQSFVFDDLSIPSPLLSTHLATNAPCIPDLPPPF